VAVSGSKNYAITGANIIESALRKLGEYDAGEAIPGDETSAALMALNLMVKEYAARGADIWLRDEITLFLQPDTKSYALGTTNATATITGETTLTNAEAISSTVWEVASSSGMTAADIVGVKTTDNTIHWDVIASVDSSTQITGTTGLDVAAASGAKVYAYTTTAGRPLKILSAFRRSTDNIDIKVEIIGESDYAQQSNKSSNGPPVEIWYQPTLTTGTLFVWPIDGGSTYDKLIMNCAFHTDDFDTTADSPQFPIEWGNTLVWGLAAELGPEYGLPEREQAKMFEIAEHKLKTALDWDVENASVIFALEEGR